MACFIVPAAEAVVTSVITRVVKTREKKEVVKLTAEDGTSCDAVKIISGTGKCFRTFRFSQR